MKYSRLYLFLFVVVTIQTCDLISPKEKEDNSAIIGLLALSRGNATGTSAGSSGSQKYPTPSCEVATPAFSTLKDAGFESTCGQSGCHITGGSSAGKFRANTSE